MTGGGVGIGRAVASALAAEGACVCVFDFDAKAAEAVADELTADDHRAFAFVGDVRCSDDAAGAVRRTVETFGSLDLLVNNAGLNRYGDVVGLAEDDWDLVVDTNLKGCFLMAKHAIGAMRNGSGGAIVNVASVQAFASQRTVPAYAASKGGVVALTTAMALDHAADGIRVNCIAPGSVRTPMLREAAEVFSDDDPETTIEGWGAVHPIGFLTEPDDVANLVLFLLSDAARTITGSCHRIDGGLLSQLGV